MWLPSNFKLDIEGVDCTRVARIELFTVGQSVGNDPKAREAALAVRRIDFPNLKLAVAEAGAQSFIDWHKVSVIEGKGSERNGTLSLFAPSQQGVLLRIKFYNVGIFSMEPAKANADQIKRVEVELYVERMGLLFGEAAGGTIKTGA